MATKTQKVIAGVAIAGALAFGGTELVGELTREKANVRSIVDVASKLQATTTSQEFVVDENTDLRTKLYLYANVTRQNKGTVRWAK